MTTLCIALLLLSAVSAVAGGSGTKVLRNGEVVQHETFRGRARWKLVPYLWTDKSVNITCSFTKVTSAATLLAADLLVTSLGILVAEQTKRNLTSCDRTSKSSPPQT